MSDQPTDHSAHARRDRAAAYIQREAAKSGVSMTHSQAQERAAKALTVGDAKRANNNR